MTDAGIIRQQVEARLEELEATLLSLRSEHAQLARLAGMFPDPGPARSGRPATTAGPSQGSRPAGPPAAARTPGGAPVGGRAQQAIALISARPGLTAADLSSAMGISRNYLYRVLPKLERRGVIHKQGAGYYMPAPGRVHY